MKRWLCKVNCWDGSMYFREGDTYDMPDDWEPPKSKMNMPEKFELMGVLKPPKEEDDDLVKPDEEPKEEPKKAK